MDVVILVFILISEFKILHAQIGIKNGHTDVLELIIELLFTTD